MGIFKSLLSHWSWSVFALCPLSRKVYANLSQRETTWQKRGSCDLVGHYPESVWVRKFLKRLVSSCIWIQILLWHHYVLNQTRIPNIMPNCLGCHDIRFQRVLQKSKKLVGLVFGVYVNNRTGTIGCSLLANLCTPTQIQDETNCERSTRILATRFALVGIYVIENTDTRGIVCSSRKFSRFSD